MPERAYDRRRESEQAETNSLKQRLGDEPIKVNRGHMDYAMLLIALVLCSIGVVMVFSVGFYRTAVSAAHGFDEFYFLRRQLIWVTMGVAIMIFMANFPYRVLMKFSFMAYAGANFLCALVPIIGEEINGARRWIRIGEFQFQPSELAKIAIIIMLAYMIDRNKDTLKTLTGFFVCCGIVLATTFLVLLGGLSNALMIALIGMGIIFIASPHIMRFVTVALGGALAVFAYILFSPERFRAERIDAWLDPSISPLGVGFQINQSLYAIASGGMFGLGIGQSRQKSFLPEAHNDFIFAIICEELGLVGAGLIIFLFSVLIWRGISVASKAPDIFSSLTASGIVLMIGGQAIINIAVVTNSMPNTGLTLPFISYGGTSLMVTMFLMGVLLNISRYSKD
ncbi:MAG: putative lipid II flippase FtsW [Defluviitaleaceae bacterium]|nr:putative lipid II flippase FtsW [Defluviitaleaceae bacterium]